MGDGAHELFVVYHGGGDVLRKASLCCEVSSLRLLISSAIAEMDEKGMMRVSRKYFRASGWRCPVMLRDLVLISPFGFNAVKRKFEASLKTRKNGRGELLAG